MKARKPRVVELDDYEQQRRCALAVYWRLVDGELGGQPPSRRGGKDGARSIVGRAFSICKARLAQHGYLVEGTSQPTLRGIKASREKAADPLAWEKRAAYEAMIASSRVETWKGPLTASKILARNPPRPPGIEKDEVKKSRRAA